MTKNEHSSNKSTGLKTAKMPLQNFKSLSLSVDYITKHQFDLQNNYCTEIWAHPGLITYLKQQHIRRRISVIVDSVFFRRRMLEESVC